MACPTMAAQLWLPNYKVIAAEWYLGLNDAKKKSRNVRLFLFCVEVLPAIYRVTLNSCRVNVPLPQKVSVPISIAPMQVLPTSQMP